MSLAAPVHRLPGGKKVGVEADDLSELGDELGGLEGDALLCAV